MITTFAIHVENKPGVLTRVSSLFRRRAFNIESLTVGHTDRPGVSRMTIVVDTDEIGARRLEAALPGAPASQEGAVSVSRVRVDAEARPRPALTRLWAEPP